MADEKINSTPDYLFPQSTIDAVTRPKIMFQRIQKRDGTIVDFDKSKIGKAIFAAAQSVGGKDRDMAENLGDLVILYLARTYEDGLLNVEVIQDAVEKVLIENGHARTVKAFILYRDQRARIRCVQSGKKVLKTDYSVIFPSPHASPEVQVQTSDDELINWDRDRIVQALVREAQLDLEISKMIASEVEIQIIYSKMQVVTVGLIRELVNAKLIEYGLIKEHRLHARLGMPVYDIEQLIFPSVSNTKVKPKSLSTVDSIIAKDIYRQYALTRVFSPDVITNHAQGKIHVHDMDSITRIVTGPVPLKNMIQNGLYLPYNNSYLKPANNLSDLVSQMVQLGSVWQQYFTDSAEWNDFNQQLASFVTSKSIQEIESQFQKFLSELNGIGENVSNRIHFSFPKHSNEVIINMFTRFMTEYNQGDDLGHSYSSIVPVIHVNESCLNTPILLKIQECIIKTICEKRKIEILFDRNITTNSTCIIHKVTLNLVDIASHSQQNQETFLAMLADTIKIAINAHKQKNQFIDHLLSSGKKGILSLLADFFGESIQEKNQVSHFAMGITGLEQTVDLLSSSPNLNFEKRIELADSILIKVNELIKNENWNSGINCYLEPTTNKHITQRLTKLSGGGYKSWTPGIDFSIKTDMTRLQNWKLQGQLHASINNRGLVLLKSLDSIDNIFQELLHQTEVTGFTIQH